MMRGSYGSGRQSGRPWTWTIAVGSVAIAFVTAAGLMWSETRAETGPGLATDARPAAPVALQPASQDVAQYTLPPRQPPAVAQYAPAPKPAPARPPAAQAAAPTYPAAPGAATPAPAQPAVAQINGFRSARFGMTDAEVRSAIERDFNLRGDAVQAQENKAEQTHVLIVRAANVLPGGGTASISYVFGFKSKTLIQVGLSWSKATDDAMTPEQLFSNANVLQSHFLTEGYKPDTVATNMPINGGVLMFRGSDADQHTTMLILQGTFTQAENNQRQMTPTALLLFYIADAKAPDVYRLPPGSF
jgi:hypothetical protein